MELAGSYWYCLYAWWRAVGRDADSATTGTLACFDRWLHLAPPSADDAGAGRMREWLLGQLPALEECGLDLEGNAVMEIDTEWAEQRFAEEPAGDAATIFQRRWALTVLEFTMRALQAEYDAAGQSALFADLAPFAGFEGGGEEEYVAVAQHSGITVGGARKAVFDFRKRHRELLRAYVADTVADLADVDSEIAALLVSCDPGGTGAAPLPTIIQRFKPDELLARAMRTVQMSSGGAGGRWTPPSDEEVARLFPQYEMLGMLGRGGMGAVYKARQVTLDRHVAIKLLPLEVSVNQDFAERFVREARAMAKLNHPNIITVYDFGTTSEGHLYFVMEFIEGANLHDLIQAAEGAAGLGAEQAAGIVSQICHALGYAHSKGIVHRDIKPANVMVNTEGTAKVADFGLARLTDPGAEQLGHTMTGTVMGTPDYMAPEQKRGMAVDHRADIFSVGVMLYEMLCKETPQGAWEPPSHRVGCDPRFDQVVIRAMHRDQEKRYQSTTELRIDLEAAVGPAPVAPRPTATGVPSSDSDATVPRLQPRPPPPPPKPRVVAPPPAPPAAPVPEKKSNVLLLVSAALLVAIMFFGSASVFKKKNRGDRPRASDRRNVPPPPRPPKIAATREEPFVNTLGMRFVPVPGLDALFSVWVTRVSDYRAFCNANPTADTSWKTVTRENVPIPREPTYPVSHVSWEDAQGFCRWLTTKEQAEGKLPRELRYRLPTDEEWSQAAGLPPEDGATPAQRSFKNDEVFGWGKTWPPPRSAGNYADESFHAAFPFNESSTNPWTKHRWLAGYDDGFPTTSPVDAFPANRYGLHDMGGNVWQWCEDTIDATQTNRVLRGPSWDDPDRHSLLLSNRNANSPGARYQHLGFRCVLAPVAEK